MYFSLHQFKRIISLLLPFASYVGFFRRFDIPPIIDLQSLVGSPDYFFVLVPVPLNPVWQPDMSLIERVGNIRLDPFRIAAPLTYPLRWVVSSFLS